MPTENVKKRILEVESFKEKNKTARDALKNELENSPEYFSACEEVKAALLKKKRIKDEIWAKTETQQLIFDIKENKEELDTLEEILSAELMDFYKESGSDTIEDDNGEPRKFKIIARLLPKKKKYDERDSDGKFSIIAGGPQES
jgi:hypothetical protein